MKRKVCFIVTPYCQNGLSKRSFATHSGLATLKPDCSVGLQMPSYVCRQASGSSTSAGAHFSTYVRVSHGR